MQQTLRIFLEEAEIEEIREIARRNHMTLDEWIHRVLQEARKSHPGRSTETKLRAVRAAVGQGLPTGDIDQMLREIEQGYRL
jgi:predicted DNA-binding ribbon-helix-helix protein